MALKILQLKNKIEIAKRSLEELTKMDADFEKRYADIEASISEAHTEAERGVIDESITSYEADLTAHDEAKKSLTREIENLEAELDAMDEPIDETKVEKVERKENHEMETRNTKEYISAYSEYIKSGDDHEVRSLLTENVRGGTVPVPDLVYDIVKTAWEREGIMSLVRKTYLKGNLRVGFEASATRAAVHTEGADAPSEETLVLGVVELKAESIKKWVTISDEVLDLKGEDFLRYLYDELTYQIAKKAADQLIAKIEACGTTNGTNSVAVPKITSTQITLGLIASAIGQLSDEAANPVILMNKQTWAAFKAVQARGNYGYDPFEGLPVIFNNSIKAFSAATTGVTYAIVGDLGHGAQANFPNGSDITIKFDDLSLAEKDLVKIVGREYVGLGITAPFSFVKITH